MVVSPWLPATRAFRNILLPSQDVTIGGKSVTFRRSTVWLSVITVTVTNT